MLRPPILSLADPEIEGESGIDPLALQRIYERLADRMFPAVTVRMSRIRFLTVMSVGAHVCSEFAPDTLAADELTPPWLVYEWFVIEALARDSELVDRRAIAGLRKVRNCLKAQQHVCNATYLKTPKVFGFTGIFRRLAEQAKILGDDVGLDDGGWELLRTFEQDEQLAGVIEGPGDGATLVRELRAAVGEGLERGHTTSRSQPFWQRIAHHLAPTRARKRERKVLLARLRGTHELSREIVDDLRNQPGALARDEEAIYLRALARRGTPHLREVLAAVDAYEAVCRPITDAFTWIRYLSTQHGYVSADDFTRARHSDRLVRRTQVGCRRVNLHSRLLELEPDVRALIDAFADVRTAGDLFAAVIAHHKRAQADKPPDGKRAWLEDGVGGKMLVRPLYRVATPPDDLPPYVHDYRTRTVGGFLSDLGAFA